MAFVPENGVTTFNTAHNTVPLTADFIHNLFAALSARLINNPRYRLPGNDQPFQTTIVVHGGALFGSRETTSDVDYLASFTDALLEAKGLEDSIVLVTEEIETVGNEAGLESTWMNFEGDSTIGQIGDGVFNDGEALLTRACRWFQIQRDRSHWRPVYCTGCHPLCGLKIYAMEWCWAFSRKLARFNDKDQRDIVALLSHLNHFALPIAQKGNIKGATDHLWAWIEKSCPLQVADWRVHNLEELIKTRILTVAMAFAE